MKPHKLNSGVVKALSNLLKDEYYANRVYRYISNCLRNSGFKYAADYYANEAADEIQHAIGLEKFATDWNTELAFLPQEGVDLKEEGLVEFIDFSYNLEYALLEKYKKEYTSAFEDGDLEVAFFLQKYVDIQCNAVAEIADQLNMLELFDKEDKNWVFQFEKKVFKK